MRLDELLNKKVKTGQQGEFSVAEGRNGKLALVTVGEKKYVIDASLQNFSRFQKWIGKSALVDIKKTGKFHKTKDYGFLPTVNIRTNIQVEADKPTETPKPTTNPEDNPKQEKMVF